MGGVKAGQEEAEGVEGMSLGADALREEIGIFAALQHQEHRAKQDRRGQQQAQAADIAGFGGAGGQRSQPARGDQDQRVGGGAGAVKVGLGLGKARWIGQADGKEGQEARAEDGKFRQDQDPHHQLAGELARAMLLVRLRLLVADCQR
jgi:hypothetical protein